LEGKILGGVGKIVLVIMPVPNLQKYITNGRRKCKMGSSWIFRIIALTGCSFQMRIH
jgi:hypothetical protein